VQFSHIILIDGPYIGFDSGDAVSRGYTTAGTFRGGTIEFVEISVDRAQYLDREAGLTRTWRD
jgi:arylsulfatase